MRLGDYKITDGAIDTNGVVSAPDKLEGNASDNKRRFDQLIREVVQDCLNGLIDALMEKTGASEIGAEVEDVTGENVAAILQSLKGQIDNKMSTNAAETALGTKADKTVVADHFKSVSFVGSSGIFTFTRESGSQVTIDTALEKVATNWEYDADNQALVLTLADESKQSVPLSAFITESEFQNSNQIEFDVTGHKVTATIKSGSVTDEMLDSALKGLLKTYAENAAASAEQAEEYKKNARAFAEEAGDYNASTAQYESGARDAESNAWNAVNLAREAAAGHAPQIRNGTWWVWDYNATPAGYKDTEVAAQGTDGEDGFSPTVEIEPTTEFKTLVTIIDAQGRHSFYVTDGTNGEDGAAGVDGKDGADGKDGISPEVTIAQITGGHTVTITDAEHPHGQSFDVMDGSAADVSGKMDKANPSGTGALSLNRAADSTVGRMSAVLGSGNAATEQFGISLGYGNQNDGQASLAAGSSNQIKKTSATNSLNTVALGMSLQAQGNAQIVLGKHNMPMEELAGAYPKYPLVFGWGTTQGKKNILVMDNEGNIDFAGSAKANGEPLAPYPCETVSGSPATTQIGADDVPVKSLEVEISATQSGSGDPSPTNIRPISGASAAALTVNGKTAAIPFGRAVYGGKLNAVTGKLTITHKMTTLSQISGWRYRSDGYFLAALPGGMYGVSSVGQKTALCSGYTRAAGGSYVVTGAANLAFTVGSTVLTADSCAIGVRDNDYTNVTEWLAAAGNYALVYELAEPETVQLTPQELRTVLGANTFAADTGEVTVTLRVDPTLALAELRAAILGSAE